MMKDTLSNLDSFIVLPDTRAGEQVAERVHFNPTDIIRYPSGRPWVLLHRRFGIASDITFPDGRAVVFIGPNHLDPQALAAELSRVHNIERVGSVARQFPGIYHVIARIGEEVRVQGTASGLKRIHFANIDGAVIASDRAEIVARAANARLDTSALAIRFLEPVPHPLAERSLWKGIRQVAPGDYLHFTRDSAHVRNWWRPPSPVLNLEDGAEAVYNALSASVKAYIGSRESVTSELSGGIDSASITCLATHNMNASPHERLLAITAEGRDALDEDAEWAKRTAAANDRIKQHVIPSGSLPLSYASLSRAADYWTEEPTTGIASYARVLAVTSVAKQHGSSVHLTGHGGDHLFSTLPTLAADLLRTRPFKGLRLVRSYSAMFEWPLRTVLGQLIRPGEYRSWLKKAASGAPTASWEYPILSWGLEAHIPEWITDKAKGLIYEEIDIAAKSVEPLATSPGRHLEIDGVRDGSRLVSALADIAAQEGVNFVAPFLDDRVMEAAFQVRLEDRVQPQAYKPLLTQAMHGVVPDELRNRTTKGLGSLDSALGIRHHSPEMRKLWESSALGSLGLANPDRLRLLSCAPDSIELADDKLLSTLGCEIWLRHRTGTSNYFHLTEGTIQ